MANGGGIEVGVAGPVRDVVAHVLAHVAVPASAGVVTRAASLFDARYVAWSRATLPSRASGHLAADAQILGQLLAASPDAHLLQALLAAFDDEEMFTAALREEASALEEPSLAALGKGARELCEITWAAIGLAWPSYREAWRRFVEREVHDGASGLSAVLESAASVLPTLAAVRVRVSHPLGPRARGFEDGIVVGTPGSWSSLEPADLAARVVHEVVVRRASELVASRAPALGAAGHWAETEGLALAATTRRLAGHALAPAHAAFVASLDCSGVALPTSALLDELLAALEDARCAQSK